MKMLIENEVCMKNYQCKNKDKLSIKQRQNEKQTNKKKIYTNMHTDDIIQGKKMTLDLQTFYRNYDYLIKVSFSRQIYHVDAKM